MLCELCEQNEANIVIKQITEAGKSVSCHICDRCAHEHGLDAETDNTKAVAELFKLIEKKKADAQNAVTCMSCGTKLSDILETHHLGCADCMIYFKGFIEEALKKNSDDIRYTGKVPKEFNILNRPTETETVQNLQAQMEEAVKIENYELAAYLRDKIKEMENGEK